VVVGYRIEVMIFLIVLFSDFIWVMVVGIVWF